MLVYKTRCSLNPNVPSTETSCQRIAFMVREGFIDKLKIISKFLWLVDIILVLLIDFVFL